MPQPRVLHRIHRRPPAWLVGGFLVLVSCTRFAGGAFADIPRPWVPPVADSLIAWSAEARARFQTNKGDSATGPNYRAYELVGRMGRRILRTLGKENFPQVGVVEAVLDTLGLETELVTDPRLPDFTLLMVRNPYRRDANAVGYLYWYAGDDLRLQGVVFRGGYAPHMRVWWTGKPEGPYEWGILDQERDPEGWLGLVFLRLMPNGYYWNVIQYEGDNPDLGRAGDAYWVDVNRDDVPEVVSWSKALADSSFQECQGCPHLITEKIFVRRAAGFELHDSRLLPSPYSTFVLFIRLLREGNRAAASRLLQDPSKLDDAIALGWGGAPGRGAWQLEYAEPDQAWPRWLALRFNAGKGTPLYIVHFTMKDARWIIQDWLVPIRKSDKSATIGGTKDR